MSLKDLAPDGYRAVVELNDYVSASVDARVLTLVKLRASIVNGCAYCTDMHGTHAFADGEPIRRLLGVAAWQETPFFTPREQAALALTDAVTLLAPVGRAGEAVPDTVWEEALAHWSEREVADLVLAIATINVWNRIAMSTQMALPAL